MLQCYMHVQWYMQTRCHVLEFVYPPLPLNLAPVAIALVWQQTYTPDNYTSDSMDDG